MTTSESISVIALIISSGGFALQARTWLMSGPRLHLSVMGDAIAAPDDGRGARVTLTVINRGTEPTMLTHMVAFVYTSRWRYFRRKSDIAGIVAEPRIPGKLDTNAHWLGQMLYDEKLRAARNEGHLYVGVISSHSDKNFLIRVPPPRKLDDVLARKIASG